MSTDSRGMRVTIDAACGDLVGNLLTDGERILALGHGFEVRAGEAGGRAVDLLNQ